MNRIRSVFSRIRTIILLLLATLIAIFGLYMVSGFWIAAKSSSVIVLRDNWVCSVNDQVLPESNIEAVIRRDPVRGDVYSCETVLPAFFLTAGALRVFSENAMLDCYLDNELIYTYGAPYLVRDGFIPKGYHLIPLSSDASGKTLKLVFTAGETQAFSALRVPMIGNLHELFIYWIYSSRAVIPVSVFIILFGFMLGTLSLFVHAFDEHYHVLFGAVVSVNTGLFALTHFDAFFFVTQNLWFSTMIEYVSKFLLPVTLSLFLQRITDDDVERNVYHVCCLSSFFLFVLAVILQLLHFYPISRSLHYYAHFSVFTCLLMVIFGCRVLYRANLRILRMRDSAVSMTQRVLLTSQATMITAVFVLLFSVLINEVVTDTPLLSLKRGQNYWDVPLMVGLVAYASLMMLSFFYHGIYVTHENSQQKRLTGLAYTDVLTGLPNRAYCYHALHDLDESNQDYCVMSLDVDYLKRTNDTRGHAAGDELLRNFAEELRSSFRASDIIGRLGGDEFIVILKGTSYEECLNKAKMIHKRIPFSFSYGCAHSRERSTRYGFGVYRLADQRMYEMKQEIHKNDG